MKNSKYIFERFSNVSILFFIASVFFVKIILYLLDTARFINFGFKGNDSDYYHAYATGNTDIAVNIWPVILRHLNELGLYSRDIISYLLFFLSLFLIPVLSAKLSNLKFNQHQKYYLYIILLCVIYPTIYIFTFDVYRDVFMVSVFLISCSIVKKCLYSNNILSFLFFFSLSIGAALFLLTLRPYLGYAFLLSLFLWKISFTKKRLIFLGISYFLVLFIVNYVGALDFLTEYRSGFEEIGGGSTLGLDFSNPILFIPNFILSAIGQLFGLYITNPFALLLFFIETLPFFFMLVYVIKNIKLADTFVRFLIIFFVIYASVWLIGNDNLGTAIRLRLYNYLAVYICFFYILRLKKSLQISKVANS